jgi:hypothetical protein
MAGWTLVALEDSKGHAAHCLPTCLGQSQGKANMRWLEALPGIPRRDLGGGAVARHLLTLRSQEGQG